MTDSNDSTDSTGSTGSTGDPHGSVYDGLLEDSDGSPVVIIEGELP